MYKVYTVYTHDQNGDEILLCEGRSIDELMEKFHQVDEYKNFDIEKLEIGLFVNEGQYDKEKPMPKIKSLNPEEDEFYHQLQETVDEA